MDDEGVISPSAAAQASAKRGSVGGDATNSALGGGIPACSSLVPGSRLEARDAQGSDQWFSVKVQEVDVEGAEVLVHYHNWNSRHDEWIPIDSPRLRVPTRTSARHDSGSTSNQCGTNMPSIEGKDLVTSGGAASASSLGMCIKSSTTKEFKSGEKVMAAWRLNRKYPAKIVRFEPDGTYLVEFFDGVEYKVKPNNIRRIRKDEQEQFDAEFNDYSMDENSVEIENIETTRSSRRRERKMKFDLKSVLNIRTTPPPTPPPTQPNSEKSIKDDKNRTEARRHSSKCSVDIVNRIPNVGAKTNLSTKEGRTSSDTSVKNKSGVKEKQVHHKALTSKKHVNQRKSEVQKKSNKTNEVHSDNESNKGKFDINSEKCNKNKRKTPNNVQPVTNGKNAVEKRKDSKNRSNNNSSKSKLVSKVDKNKENNETKTEMQSSKSVEIVQPVTGKRERKRKKFWDEEEFPVTLPPSKISKKRSTETIKKEKSRGIDSSPCNNKHKNRRTSEAANVDAKPSKCKDNEVKVEKDSLDETRISTNSTAFASNEDTKIAFVKTSKQDENLRKQSKSQEQIHPVNSNIESCKLPKPQNGKVLLYRTSFDMADDPSKTAAKMIEGVNIPGPGVSIPVDSSKLPKGWEKRVIQRGIGVTKGKWDVFIVEEDGRKSFRSKTDLQKHIDDKKLPYNSDAFDFSLDDNLKKLRQIWKQYIVKPRLKPGERMTPSVPAKKGKKKNDSLPSPSSLSSFSQLSSLTGSTLALQTQQNRQFASSKGHIGTVPPMLIENNDSKKPIAAVPLLADVSNSETNINDDVLQQTIILRRQELEAELIATKLGVLSETGQGLRCSIPACGKLFRKEKLLRQHVKHYHPNEYMAVIRSSKLNDYLDHENDMLKEPKSVSSLKHLSHNMNVVFHTSEKLNIDDQNADNKKRKLYQQQFEFGHENNKRLKRNNLMYTKSSAQDRNLVLQEHMSRLIHPNAHRRKRSQHSADEDDLEIDSPSSLSHMPSLMNTMPRNRHDSILSASSGFSDGDLFNDKLIPQSLEAAGTGCLPKQKGKMSPATPPTPPTFRFSKRRQAQLRANRRNDKSTPSREQSELGSSRAKRNLGDESILSTLMSPKVALTPLDESMLTSPVLALNDNQQLSLSSVTEVSQVHVASPIANVPGQSSYPPSEMDVLSVTGSEHLTTEELVNCSCRRLEEDGLMIQCDICLCWQHGSCLAIEEEDQVPEYYVCETCRHPRLGRTSAQYSVDQDWLNKGLLPTVISSFLPQKEESSQKMNIGMQQSSFATASPKQPLVDKETAFRKLSELMADLSNLSKLLHSLRVKLHVASQSNNSKVFMWSSIWDPPTSLVASHLKQEDVPVASFNSQQLFNTGGILTSMEESEVNLSHDDLAANLSLIQPSSIRELHSMSHRHDPHSAVNKLDLQLPAPFVELKSDSTPLQQTNISENTAKEESIEAGQCLSFPATANAGPVSNGCQSTEEDEGDCASSSSYQQQNTLSSEPQAQLPFISTHPKLDRPAIPGLVTGGKCNNALTGQQNQQPSISDCTQSENALSSILSSSDASSQNLENHTWNNVHNGNKTSNDTCDYTNTEESSTEKFPKIDFQTNGINSEKEKCTDYVFEEPKQPLEGRLSASNKASEMLVNGNISDDVNEKDYIVPLEEPKKHISQLRTLSNKENELKSTNTSKNGQTCLSIKNSAVTICNDTKNDDIEDKNNGECSAKSQTTVKECVIENSEPQVNGLVDRNNKNASDMCCNDETNSILKEKTCTSKNVEKSVLPEENMKNTKLDCIDTSLPESIDPKKALLCETNFAEQQQQDIVDENQDEVDASMIPSLSEVQQLLPSLMSSLEEHLINDQQQTPANNSLNDSAPCMNDLPSDVGSITSIEIGCRPLQQFHSQIVPVPSVIFPETKRLDKDECRLNLLHHIDALQTEFEYRLSLVEKTLAEIDSKRNGTEIVTSDTNDLEDESDPVAKTKAILTLLLQDLRTSKNLVSLV